jgi:low affinity Fe/Cu permease
MMETISVTFRKLADLASYIVGTPYGFVFALTSVIVWGIMGPLFHYSTTWQLTINTGTTIVTYMLVFLIQSSQNKDTRAIQLKLDQLLAGISEVDEKGLVGIEQNPKQMKKELKNASS